MDNLADSSVESLLTGSEDTLPPAEDFVVAQTADDDGPELSLAPPEGMSPAETARLIGRPDWGPTSTTEAAGEPRANLRFSLLELLAAMTFISLALAAATWLPLQIFVGVTGLCVVVLLTAFALLPPIAPESRMVKLAWWTLIGTYFVSTAVAAARALIG
jgi:hypothetical protein